MTAAPSPVSSARTVLAPAALVLVGALLGALAPVVGLVRTADGSPPGPAGAAPWAVLLVPVVVLALAAWRPLAGLAAAAGAGTLAAGRLLADLGAVTDPGDAVRPELFHEASVHALPVTAAPAGAVLLLAGDLLAVAGGLLAARGMVRAFGDPDRDPVDPLAADGPPAVGALAGGEGAGDGADGPGLAVRGAGGDDAAEVRRAGPPVVVGLLGAVAVLVGAVSVPYAGGYLASRALPPALGLWDLSGALVLAVLAGAAVLVAPLLPRRLAAALLCGVAAAVAVPALTALLVRAAGIGVRVEGTVWALVAGGLLLALSVPLLRRGPRPPGGGVATAGPGSDVLAGGDRTGGRRLPGLLAGVLALLAAGAAVLAARTSGLLVDGAADPPRPGGYPLSASIGGPFLVVALLLAVAGVAALVPATAPAGAAALGLAWLPAVWATTAGLAVYGTVRASAQVTAGVAGATPHRWSMGPGLWWGIVASLLGVAAAVSGVVAVRRLQDARTDLVDEDSSLAVRQRAGVVAAVLVVAVLVSGLLPVLATSAGSGPTLLSGSAVDGAGLLLLCLGVAAGLVAGLRSDLPSVVVGAGVAAAAALLVRLVVPAAVRAQDGFALRAGYPAVVAAAVLVLAGSVLVAGWAARVPSDPARGPAGGVPAGDPGRSARGAAAAGARMASSSPRSATRTSRGGAAGAPGGVADRARGGGRQQGRPRRSAEGDPR
ncbi:hypothetical protein [Nakamurella endophytica]|uniref:Uncharacterized protein n=1 Tax=Nakamurella endophytica TaxID=1748367 RepID=A0A917SXA7_9ACTN|nr:hypothetical protein [Nakamurella endophytica]GGM02617.1 hypothetical protein GCM10011594_23420 [Nakamurella endophytica]